jgi:hypothetical protein
MAIVKASYSVSPKAARATIRYISCRPNLDGRRQSRQLFTEQGATGRLQAYAMIDGASPGDYFYRLAISPDPRSENPGGDLHLRAVTEETIRALAESTGKPLDWVAVIHTDHTPIPHVHCLAIVHGRLDRAALAAAREGATLECQLQRRELDAYRQAEQDRSWEEEAQWDYSSPFSS